VLATLAAEGAIGDREVEVRRADGRTFWAEATLAPVEVGGQSALVCCFVDLTARRALAEAEAEEVARERLLTKARLRRAEARAQAIVEAFARGREKGQGVPWRLPHRGRTSQGLPRP